MDEFKTLAECLVALDTIDGRVPESNHAEADAILLTALTLLGATDLVDAYTRLVERAAWWGTA